MILSSKDARLTERPGGARSRKRKLQHDCHQCHRRRSYSRGVAAPTVPCNSLQRALMILPVPRTITLVKHSVHLGLHFLQAREASEAARPAQPAVISAAKLTWLQTGSPRTSSPEISRPAPAACSWQARASVAIFAMPAVH